MKLRKKLLDADVETGLVGDVADEHLLSVLFLYDPCLKGLFYAVLILQVVVSVMLLVWMYASAADFGGLRQKLLGAFVHSVDPDNVVVISP